MISHKPFPIPDLGRDTILCSGESLTLVPGTPDAAVLWGDTLTSPEYVVNEPGTYTVEVMQNGCKAGDTIIISYQNLPVADLGKDTILCPGEMYTLDPGAPDANVRWGDTLSSPVYIVERPGTYTVEINQDGCRALDTIQVGYKELADQLNSDTTFCPGDRIVLEINAPAGQVVWEDGTIGSSRIIDLPGNYILEIMEESCTYRDSIQVSYHEDCQEPCKIFIPNIFSPNGDAQNDEFLIRASCTFGYYQLYIYNRWGNLVFSADDPLLP